MGLDAKANFAKSRVTAYYGATETQIVVADASVYATPPFNGWWWDGGNYPDPADDPLHEIDRVTAINLATNTLTLQNSGGNRLGQEGTTASTKNTSGGTYYFACGLTKKDIDDLESQSIDVGTAYCWITEHGATGDGSTDDYNAFNDAVTAGRTTIVIPSGTYVIGTNLTFGTDTHLVFMAGAQLSPSTGTTVTINGTILAGNYQIFTGAGTVTIGSRQLEEFARWPGTAAELQTSTRTRTGTVVESAAIDVSSTGSKTCQIAHGLSYTPSEKYITLTPYRSSGSNTPIINAPYILGTDGTNIDVYFYVTTAAATTYMKVAAHIAPE